MKTGVLRNLRMQLLVAAQMAGTQLAVSVLLLVWQMLTNSMEYLALRMSISAVVYGVLIGLVMAGVSYSTLYQCYLPAALGFSSSRKASFLTAQATKLVYSLITVLVTMLLNGLVMLLWREAFWAAVAPVCLLTLFGLLPVMSIAELLTLLAKKFGKIGAVLLVLVFAMLGGCGGFLIGYSGDGDLLGYITARVQLLPGGLVGAACCILLAVSVLLSLISWRLYRHSPI
ncbi:MAG: hypothetical protein MSH10_07070 [Pygmaiobacter massiliensis]|nr:hypothetical protein [Pygmaiobacter massiliensis]